MLFRFRPCSAVVNMTVLSTAPTQCDTKRDKIQLYKTWKTHLMGPLSDLFILLKTLFFCGFAMLSGCVQGRMPSRLTMTENFS